MIPKLFACVSKSFWHRVISCPVNGTDGRAEESGRIKPSLWEIHSTECGLVKIVLFHSHFCAEGSCISFSTLTFFFQLENNIVKNRL